jgi:hypothetical protein
MRRALVVIGLSVSAVFGCMRERASMVPVRMSPSVATFTVPEAALPKPLVLVAYGDMRFTDPAETHASNPAARQALVAKIAAEEPAAIFVNGDLTWHGVSADYQVYHGETAHWRDQHVRVYPALGNHEFAGCEPAACLDRWWGEFPEIHGRRWYSVALGERVLMVALDTNASLLPAAEQRVWLENQMAGLDPAVRFVFIVIHHPPLADVQTEKMIDHNPRPNEQSLAEYLETIAPKSRARFIVSAGHIHNYERFQRAGVVFLVSGGGGARPYEVDRTPADLYQHTDFPNFHYVRFELAVAPAGVATARVAALPTAPGVLTLVGEMIRLGDSAAAVPKKWEVRDRFEISLPP